jgi:hypothetical protein
MTSASNAAIMAKMESQVLAEYAAVAANLDHVSPLCCGPRCTPLGNAPKLPSGYPSHSRADMIRKGTQIASTTHKLASIQPHLLNELRPLERKLGLVLTLFKGEPCHFHVNTCSHTD